MRKIAKTFLRSSAIYSASQTLNLLITLASNVLLARLLSPQKFGIFFFATSTYELISIFARFGFSLTIVQRDDIDQDYFDTALWAGIINYLLLFVIIIPLILINPLKFESTTIKLLIVLGVFGAYKYYIQAYGKTLERDLKFKIISIATLFSSVSGAIIAVVYAYFTKSLWSLLLRDICMFSLLFFFYRKYTKYSFTFKFSKSDFKDIFTYGKSVFFVRAMEIFTVRFKEWVVGYFLGQTNLGYFSQASKFAEYGHRLGGPAVNLVSYSTFSKLKSNSKDLAKSIRLIHYVLIRVFLLLSLGTFLFGEEFIVLLYGEQWRIAGKIFKILFPYLFCLTIYGNIKQYFMSIDKIYTFNKIQFMQVFMFLVVFTFGAIFFGIYGTAIILDIIFIITLSISYHYLSDDVNINYFKLVILPIGLFVPIVIFSYLIISSIIIDNILIEKSIIFLSSLSFFILLLYLFERQSMKKLYFMVKESI